MKARLVRNDTQFAAALTRRRHAAESSFRTLAARLDGLSPLAVLARGYAVCWNDSRTEVIRSSAAASPGDHVIVTLGAGELRCEVNESRSEDGHDH